MEDKQPIKFNEEKQFFEVPLDKFYNQLYKHNKPSPDTLKMFKSIEDKMKNIKSGMNLKSFVAIMAIVVTILIFAFSNVFESINNVDGKCNAHIQSHSIISEQLGEIKTNINWIKNKLNNI